MTDTALQLQEDEGPAQITRNELGHFVKGVSGNPDGKPKGARSRTKLIKEAMEEALTRELSTDFLEILTKAVELAKEGDAQMIKLVLVDLMKDIRVPEGDESKGSGSGKLEVSITQFLGSNDDVPTNLTIQGN